jgi:hypothetical protein
MTSLTSVLEREALDNVERRLTGQGYTLVREPSRGDLPPFLGGFRPDAIATGKSPSLIVEVIARGPSGEAEAAKVKQLKDLVAGHPGWKVEVVYTAPSLPVPSVASPEAIRQRFREIRRLADSDRPAALIMGWSLLEAVARALLPDRATRGLTPATTVELLASLGYIVQSEADKLGEAGRARNLIVHGDVSVKVTSLQLESVLEIVDVLIGHLERRTPLAV